MTTKIKRYHIYFGATRESVAHYPDDAEQVSFRGWLLKHDTARLLADNESLDATEDAVKIGIAGPSGTFYAIFATHVLESAAEREARRIYDFLFAHPEFSLDVVGFGFSRGAIGLKLIVAKLSNFSIDKHRLNISLVLHDPVTGDSKTGASISPKTLTQKSSNLSKSDHIGDVLCLYAQEQGVALGDKPKIGERLINPFFGSQITQWPPYAYVEEDVYENNHLIFDIKLPANTRFDSEIAISRIQRVICERSFAFLYQHGYRSQLGLSVGDICSREAMENFYEEAKTIITTSTKDCHDLSSVARTSISAKQNLFYNRHHAALIFKESPGWVSDELCSLRIERKIKRNAIKLDFCSELFCERMRLVAFCNELHWRLPSDVHNGEKGKLLRTVIETSLSPEKIRLNVLFVLVVALALQNVSSLQDDSSSESNKSLEEPNQIDLVLNLLNFELKYKVFKNFFLLEVRKNTNDLLVNDDLLNLVLAGDKDNSYFDSKNSEMVYRTIEHGLLFAEKKVPDSYDNSFFKIDGDNDRFFTQTRLNQRSFRP